MTSLYNSSSVNYNNNNNAIDIIPRHDPQQFRLRIQYK